MAAIPKFSELRPPVQIAIIVAVGAGLWALTEYVWPLPDLRTQVTTLQGQVSQLEAQVQPLRQYRQNLGPLVAENAQLALQLENLRRIVPNEKEVDNFVRLVQAEALSSGIVVRRFTAQAVSQQEFYVEVPFEIEMDGPFYDVMEFYGRLARMERIVNVSELRMGGTQSKKSVGQRQFQYTPSTTVAAICRVTTFFSTEGLDAETAPAAAGAAAAVPGAPAQPVAAR
jgi:type IV pilus assembly protein PilO